MMQYEIMFGVIIMFNFYYSGLFAASTENVELIRQNALYYILIPLLVIAVVAFIIIAFVLLLPYLKTIFKKNRPDQKKKDKEDETDWLSEIIKPYGFGYEKKQDVFYSLMDPWQRNYGYCRLYDEAAAPMSMIIDCDPVCFEYGGKSWLIEFWKGQYGMTTGCEVGVFTTEEPDFGYFNGTIYNSASDREMLPISLTLFKNNQKVFKREDRHWWLTGFKLGEFSEPSELKVSLSITLKDNRMCDAFIRGLRDANWRNSEIKAEGTTVSLMFDKPHTPQPITRVKSTDWIIQRKNQLLCEKYRELTGAYATTEEKLKALEKLAPDLFEKVLNFGKTKQFFELYKHE